MICFRPMLLKLKPFPYVVLLYLLLVSRSHQSIFQPRIQVLRDKQRRDEKGRPKGRGVAFVEFSEHIHALACLRVMNNNPKFAKLSNNGSQRLIVGFAVENKSKLRKQQMLREEQELRNQQKAEAQRIIRERQELLQMMEGEGGGDGTTTKAKIEEKEILTKKGRASKRKKLSSSVKSLTNVGAVANAVIATTSSLSSNSNVVEVSSEEKKKKTKKRKKRNSEDDVQIAELEEVDTQRAKRTKRRRKKNKSIKMDKDDVAFDGMVAKYKKTLFENSNGAAGGDDRWFV